MKFWNPNFLPPSAPNSWFSTTWQGGHVGCQYNRLISRNIYMKIRFKFPEERSAFFLNHQHGRRDVTCKPAIKALKKRPLKIYPLELISEIPSTIDCKTVRIFASSSTREQSNKRSGTRLKTESETGDTPVGRVILAHFACVRLLHRFLYWFWEKKPTVLQSISTRSHWESPSPMSTTRYWPFSLQKDAFCEHWKELQRGWIPSNLISIPAGRKPMFSANTVRHMRRF